MADEANEETAAPEPIADAPARRSRVILLAGLPGLVVALGGAAAFFMLAEPEQEPASAVVLSAAERQEREALRGKVDGVDYAEEMQIGIPDSDVAAGGDEAEGEDAEGPAHIGEIFNLQPFVVNITDRDSDRFLKLKADLELSDEKVVDELEQRLPQVRDLVISLLGGKSFEDIRTIEGKNFLREEILLRINALLVTGKARRVFFTEFVVQ